MQHRQQQSELNMDWNPDRAEAYVARQTIVSAGCHLVGYELLFRDSWENACPDVPLSEATIDLVSRTQLSLELERLVGANTAFINFPQHSLLKRFPSYFDPERIVVEIMETVEPTDEIIAVCTELKERGYRLALDDFDFNKKWQRMSHLVDIIKIDISAINPDILSRKVATLVRSSKTLIAERIETREQFERCRSIGFDYFQGFHFARPEILEQKKLDSNHFAMLQLLADLPEPNLG